MVKNYYFQPKGNISIPMLLSKMSRAMKLTCILLCISVGFAFASQSYAQNATLSMNMVNRTVLDVLDAIEKQSDFQFFYNSKIVNVHRKVSMTVKNKDVFTILELLFENTNIDYKVVDKDVILTMVNKDNVVDRKTDKVTGVVKDERSGEPIIGANVIIKGTTNGTITDLGGNFSLEVSEGAALQISYIGYNSQEYLFKGERNLLIKLKEDTQKLDEVVVVGYSTKNQSQLSSSVSVVTEQALQGVSSDNISKILQGKSSGVVVSNQTGHPGSTPTIIVRGTGSIGAGTAPLYVVDGIIGGIANPNDIASISILKDAAATGLYGSRAANGVIIITTKSGKAGKTRINVDSSFGYGWKPSSNLKMMNSKEFYDLNKVMYTDKYNTMYDSYLSKLMQSNPSPSQAEIDAYMVNQKLSPTLNGYIEENIPASLMNTNTDWQDLTYRTAVSHNHSVSVSGGGEKTQFYAALNYYKEDGTFIMTGYEQFNLRANIKHNITDKFSITFRTNNRYSKKESNPNADALWDSYVLLPWDDPYNPDGTMKKGTEPEWRGRHKRNLLYPMQYNYNHLKKKSFTTDIKLEYKVTDWLTLSTTNRVESETSIGEIYYDKRTTEGANSKGELSNPTTDGSTILTSNLATLSKDFGKHSLSGIIGYEYQKSTLSNITAIGMGIEPGFEILDVTAEAKKVAGGKEESIFSSVFFQADYAYNNRYFFVGSYRRDGSSRFGTENRYGNFYSLGGSWLLSNESFLSEYENLDILKLRLSFGTTGNANIADFLSYGIYNYDAQYAGSIASYPAQMPNPYLTWEVAHTLNVGVDVGFFNRIRLELDAYQRTNKDLLQDVPLSSSSGFTTQKRNVGSVRNRGVDINLQTQNITGEFNWLTNVNFSLNRNKVLKLSDGNPIVSGNKSIAEGHELGYFYMREWAGVDAQTGNPLWVRWLDENGNTINENDGTKPAKIETTSVYNDASLLYTKTIHPKFTAGFRNTLSYKGFELDFLFNIVCGSNVYNSARELIDSDGTQATQNFMKLMDDWSRWEKPGDIATHPKLVLDSKSNSNKVSSRYIENASHIRLQNITFSYTFPKKWIEKLYLNNLRLYVSGDNIWLITKYSGQDPEFNLEGGSDGWKYPTPRKVMFGLNLEF